MKQEHLIDIVYIRNEPLYLCTCGKWFKTVEEQVEHYKEYNLMKIEPLVLEEQKFKYKTATQVINKINELIEQVNKIQDKIE